MGPLESAALEYRRKTDWRFGNMLKRAEVSVYAPVSYTHLDVYKRQVEKGGDEVWIGEKFQSNPEIAGSPRNSFRASPVTVRRR